MKRTLPSLVNRTRSGGSLPTAAHGDQRAPRRPPMRGPGRCPGCRPPAAWPRPRRARCRSRCRRRSRSRASSGSPRARLGEGVPPVLPEEVLVQAGREVVPRQHLVLGAVAVHVPVDREPAAAMASVPEVEPEALAPLLEGAAGPPDVLDDRDRGGDRPGWRGPRPASPSGSCHLSCTPRALRSASRSRPTLRCSSATVFWPNHWNGVNGLGTKPPTDTVTDARWRVPLADLDAACRPARRCRACPRRSRWAGR